MRSSVCISHHGTQGAKNESVKVSHLKSCYRPCPPRPIKDRRISPPVLSLMFQCSFDRKRSSKSILMRYLPPACRQKFAPSAHFCRRKYSVIAESGSLARSSLTASLMVLIFVIKIPPSFEIGGGWTIRPSTLLTQEVSPVREAGAPPAQGRDKFPA